MASKLWFYISITLNLHLPGNTITKTILIQKVYKLPTHFNHFWEQSRNIDPSCITLNYIPYDFFAFVWIFVQTRLNQLWPRNNRDKQSDLLHWFSGMNKRLKVVSVIFLLVCFLSLKETSCKTRKNVFYFISKALFVLEKIKV